MCIFARAAPGRLFFFGLFWIWSRVCFFTYVSVWLRHFSLFCFLLGHLHIYFCGSIFFVPARVYKKLGFAVGSEQFGAVFCKLKSTHTHVKAKIFLFAFRSRSMSSAIISPFVNRLFVLLIKLYRVQK